MRLRNLLIILGVFSLGFLGAIGPSYADNVSTEGFVRKFSIANQFEIESSKLALDKSQNNAVRKFAERMIDNHTKSEESFKEALEASSTKAEPVKALDKEHQKQMDTLKAAPQEKFDEQYINMQTDLHKKAVALFGDYAKNGKDAKLKEFADKTLPTLQDHLKHVQDLKE